MNTPVIPSENPKIERRIRSFLKVLNSTDGPPIHTLPPAEARKVLVDAQASVPVALPPCDIENRTITQEGIEVPLTIVRPAGLTEKRPAFMFFHGGGWILGDFPTHERFVRDLVADSGFPAVFVNYTPSPEAQFPVPLNQAYAATQWVAANGDSINVDGRKLAVVGNSAGGNMAAAVAILAKQRGGPALRNQILFWPVTDANFQTGSYQEYGEGYFLTKAMMEWFWDAYVPDHEMRAHILCSPLQGTLAELAGLPPALIQPAGNDVLRDEGEAYARKLDAAGVDVTVVRYDGLIHDYGLLNALSSVPAVRAALHQAAEELKHHLGR